MFKLRNFFIKMDFWQEKMLIFLKMDSFSNTSSFSQMKLGYRPGGLPPTDPHHGRVIVFTWPGRPPTTQQKILATQLPGSCVAFLKKMEFSVSALGNIKEMRKIT